MARFYSPIVRTKIIPPPRNPRTLARPRVSQLLKQALEYRLTILQAEAGYGKSTALAALAGEIKPMIWYQVNEEDNDPLVFLLHVCHAIQYALPEITDLPITHLEDWDGTPTGGWYPDQCLSVAEAVWGSTMGAALVCGREAELGSITPGKLADLVVLDRDIFEIEPMEIPQTQVVMTVFGGQIVFEG